MQKRPLLACIIGAALLLGGCDPTYNWRDYRSPDAPYRIMFPAKPAIHTRNVDLNGLQVEMTMTAAEVEGTMFAVGTGLAPDAARAQAAVGEMKAAMLRNIGATVQHESTHASGADEAAGTSIDIDAVGNRNGQPARLRGHFESRGKRFYQVIVLGRAQGAQAEQVDQFVSSFKLL